MNNDFDRFVPVPVCGIRGITGYRILDRVMGKYHVPDIVSKYVAEDVCRRLHTSLEERQKGAAQ